MRKLTLEEYKSRVLNVLIKIDDICRKNNFNYAICYGTLLGAVRHQGFIPWDDDIDIVMPRKDYYLLGKYIINHPEVKLNYIDISNREDTIYYCAKICDPDTYVKESDFKHVDGYGAFVDVFPLDYLPDDSKKRHDYIKRGLYLERLAQHGSRLKAGSSNNIKQNILLKASFIYSHLFNPSNIIKKMHKKFIEFDKKPTNYIGVPYEFCYFRPEWFNELVELNFENHKFLAPKYYDDVLRSSYGNYLELPPASERVYKHHLECFQITE